MQIADAKGIDFTSKTIVVVGAYGIVGRPSALLLAELNPKKMILTGPSEEKLAEVKKEMSAIYGGEIFISSDNTAIKDADIIILSTTSASSIVTPAILRRDAVVLDMAQPHNMSQEVCDARPDVTRIDGGYMKLPGIRLNFKMGPPVLRENGHRTETTFACLTETMVSTLIGDNEHHVGLVDVGFAKNILTKAKEMGFSLAPLTNFSKSIEL